MNELRQDAKLFSLIKASAWLSARGLRRASRTSLYIAIARGDLIAKELMPRTWVVRRADLEAYASKLEANAAVSA
jgi:hypothetical protein